MPYSLITNILHKNPTKFVWWMYAWRQGCTLWCIKNINNGFNYLLSFHYILLMWLNMPGVVKFRYKPQALHKNPTNMHWNPYTIVTQIKCRFAIYNVLAFPVPLPPSNVYGMTNLLIWTMVQILPLCNFGSTIASSSCLQQFQWCSNDQVQEALPAQKVCLAWSPGSHFSILYLLAIVLKLVTKYIYMYM